MSGETERLIGNDLNKLYRLFNLSKKNKLEAKDPL